MSSEEERDSDTFYKAVIRLAHREALLRSLTGRRHSALALNGPCEALKDIHIQNVAPTVYLILFVPLLLKSSLFLRVKRSHVAHATIPALRSLRITCS